MRHLLLFFIILLLPAAPAMAQVTVDLRALDALPQMPGATAERHPVPGRPARPPAVVAKRPAKPVPRATVASATPPTATAATAPLPPPPHVAAAVAPAAPQAHPVVPSVPAAPPQIASIPPVQPPLPPAHPQPPPVPPVAAKAATTATSTSAGLRLTFAADQSDLSPGSAHSIAALVKAVPNADTTVFNVLAYASGPPDDPSVARRLSLARGIAVRDALIADGVPSTRVYLRALGSQPGRGVPPDRVDIDVQGGNAGPQAAAQQ